MEFEQIISFETAKIAQEKGCNVSSCWYYDLDQNNKLTYGTSDVYGIQQFNNGRAVQATSQSLLHKYLRSKGIYITVTPCIKYNQKWLHALIYFNSEVQCGMLDVWTYEEAMEWSLQKVLINLYSMFS